MKGIPVFAHPHVRFSGFIQPFFVWALTFGPGNAAAMPNVIEHRPCRETWTHLSFYSTLLLSKTQNVAEWMRLKQKLPAGQKQPSTHCFMHTRLSWWWRQVSGHALPHSLYCMLKGHLLAVPHQTHSRCQEQPSWNKPRVCDCIAYHRAWRSSKPPASHRRESTDARTPRGWNTCTGCCCSCCCTGLWRTSPRRNLRQAVSYSRGCGTLAGFPCSVFSAGRDWRSDLKHGSSGALKLHKQASHTSSSHFSEVTDLISVHLSSLSLTFHISP